MQCAGALQVVRQALPAQVRLPGHSLLGRSQVPSPSHIPMAVNVVPVHVAAPQLVPTSALEHMPFPLQRPVRPQGGAATQRVSACPGVTGRQLPGMPVTLQAWQVPQVAAPQQTPSVQNVLWHSAPTAQAWPSRFRPHDPPSQTLPGEQSPSPAQAALQVVPLQAYASQDCVTAGRQTPAPSQVRASVAVGFGVPVGQVAFAHWTPAA